MLSQIGKAQDCRLSLNGSTQPRRSRSTEILLNANDFIQAQFHPRLNPLPQGAADAKLPVMEKANLAPSVVSSNKCSATFGNGRGVRIRLIPVIGPNQARLANTTASSCAINMCCAAVPAPR